MSYNHPYTIPNESPWYMTTTINGELVTVIIPEDKGPAGSRIWITFLEDKKKGIHGELNELLKGLMNPTEEFEDKVWSHVCKEYKDLKAAGMWELQDEDQFKKTVQGMLNARYFHGKQIMRQLKYYKALLKRQEEDIEEAKRNNNGRGPSGGSAGGGSGRGSLIGMVV